MVHDPYLGLETAFARPPPSDNVNIDLHQCTSEKNGLCIVRPGEPMSWKGLPIEGIVWTAHTLSKIVPVTRRKVPRDIFVFRSSDLGDLLTTTPLFEALRRRFPTTRIIAGVGSWGHPILANNPFVDEVIVLDAPWNNKVVPNQTPSNTLSFLFRSEQVLGLRERGGFDIGIDVLGSHVGSLLMMRLGVRYRVGVRGYRGGWSGCDQYIRFTRAIHVARAALAQAELLGATDLPEARPQIYLTAAERSEADEIWSDTEFSKSKRLLVACGGGFESKCWPAEAFGETLKTLSSGVTGAETLNIVLVGGPADRERAARVMAARIPNCRSFCGETSLRTTLALAEQADIVLTNASMMLHVAAAFFRPTVAVLGGIHTDLVEHDRLWGYPPPYVSVGPQGNERWPSVERVAHALREQLSSVGGRVSPLLPTHP
jgi:ADP-heptose:LPS heptosyltransferase